MARHLRIEYPGALYHITARGNDRRPIFETDEDRRHLLELLAEGMERYEVRLYAYVFLTSHYHLAVQTEHPNLHEFMHYLNTKRIARSMDEYGDRSLFFLGHGQRNPFLYLKG